MFVLFINLGSCLSHQRKHSLTFNARKGNSPTQTILLSQIVKLLAEAGDTQRCKCSQYPRPQADSNAQNNGNESKTVKSYNTDINITTRRLKPSYVSGDPSDLINTAPKLGHINFQLVALFRILNVPFV